MNNLKRYREQKNLSQERLAELLLKDDGSSVGRTVISQLETGKRRLNLKTAEKLGAILNVDPYELIGEELLVIEPKDSKDLNKMISSLSSSFNVRKLKEASNKRKINPMPFQKAKELVKKRLGTDLTEEGYGLILSIAGKEGR